MSSSSLCFFLGFLSLTCVSLCSQEQCIHSPPAMNYSSAVKKERPSGKTCGKDDIVIYQSPSGRLPNGIPLFTVDVVNECTSPKYCTFKNVHLKCGAFSSYHLVDPRLFIRVKYDDCIVKNGHTLAPGEVFTFVYSNSFCYPLSVSSATCVE